jgi:hypothetical protein
VIVRLMGGPLMGKIVDVSPHTPLVVPIKYGWSDHNADVLTQQKTGIYKPSKRPGYWVFEGNYKGDPFKSYRRKVKKWQRMSRQSGLPLMLSRSF